MKSKSPLNADHDQPVGKAASFFILTIIIGPFIGAMWATWSAIRHGVDIYYVALGAIMYVITGLGITGGFHRLFTHESFRAHPAVKFILGVLGTMAYEGRIVVWCSDHITHHQHSDKEGDPHSPWRYGTGFWQLVRGWGYSHIGWLIGSHNPSERARQRFLKDPVCRAVDKFTWAWMTLSVLVPIVAGWLHEHSWAGAWQGFLWGFLVRVFFLHHATWCVNSYCHIWGKRPFQSNDKSTNSVIIGFAALGEGHHHNHHVFQKSCKHNLFHPWLDATYVMIWILKQLRLAWDLKMPTREEILAKLKTPTGQPAG